MAKKQRREGPEEQARRFREAVQALVDAGELSPTDADERFEESLAKVLKDHSKSE